MLQSKIISIIIPTYNMKDYLTRCVDSLIVKEYDGKYEIIIVNDGSTDNSLEIANSYKKRYPNIITIINKKNGHYGSTVNAGLKVAQGKYFKVLDADDWFNNNDFKGLLSILSDEYINVDMIFTYWTINNFFNNTKTVNNKHKNPTGIVIDIDEIIPDYGGNSFYSFYGITYRTSLLREIGYHQTEGICYTDIEYSLYPALKAKTAMFLNLNIYQYFIGRDGQTISVEAAKRNLSHFYKVAKRMLDTFEYETSSVKKFFQYYQFKLITNSLYTSYICYNNKKTAKGIDLKDFDKRLKDIQPIVYKELESLSYLRFHYVFLWRRFGINLSFIYDIKNRIKYFFK